MKPADTLTTLFRHNLWANLGLLEKCAQLTAEQLDATVQGTYGSIRDTLEHMVRAEKSYFSRISTGRPYRRPEGSPPLTLTEMTAWASESGGGLIAWTQKAQGSDLVEIDWDGTLRDVPKGILFTQVINHATEHRSQVMTILTQLGIEPPDLDSWTYFDEMDRLDG